MRKRAVAWACRPGELSVNWEFRPWTRRRPSSATIPQSRGARDTVGQLADEPRPPESFPYGSPDLRRLRAGRYRVFYTIDENGG
jgi:hypothetical protein